MKRKLKNAFLKGTFVGAACMFMVGTLCMEANPIGGVIVAAISGAYVFAFIHINSGRWDGVLL